MRLTEPTETDWRWAIEGKPHLLEADLGRGKVIAVLRSLRNPDFRKTAGPRLLRAIEAKAPPAARSVCPDFELTVHQATDGRRYLGVINRNVDDRARDVVIVSGMFRRCVDLDVPGGFPVPTSAGNGCTKLSLSLEPGEFTILSLGQ